MSKLILILRCLYINIFQRGVLFSLRNLTYFQHSFRIVLTFSFSTKLFISYDMNFYLFFSFFIFYHRFIVTCYCIITGKVFFDWTKTWSYQTCSLICIMQILNIRYLNDHFKIIKYCNSWIILFSINLHNIWSQKKKSIYSNIYILYLDTISCAYIFSQHIIWSKLIVYIYIACRS